MNELSEIISGNLIKLRKAKKLTQVEFANEIKYSDKSVSKWETGEAIPNVEILMKIAKFYGVTINDLVDENFCVNEEPSTLKTGKYNKVIITLLAISVVWLLATILFIYAQLIFDYSAWLVFVYSVPISCIIAVIFNSLWGKRRYNYIFISIFNWTFLTAMYLQFIQYNVFVIYFIGIPVQIAILLWSKLKKKHVVNVKNKKSEN